MSILLASIPVVITAAVYWDYSSTKHGYRKIKYLSSSNFNPCKLLDGKKWTDTSILKKRHGKKDGVFLGNFRFSSKALKSISMPYFWKKHHEKTEIYLDPIKDLRETTILYSGMGGGKSVFIINILEQVHLYDNALVHDGGKLELVAKFYNPLRGDIILNPTDERASIVDILAHDSNIAAEFFTLLLRDSSKESNYFTKGSVEHFIGILNLTNAQTFENAKEKWNYFIEKLEDLIMSAIIEKQKSEMDVIGTLKQQMTPFLLLNYRIQNDENLKLFTAAEFLDKTQGAKLFVSYPPVLKNQLKSFSSAFIHMYNLCLLSKDETKTKTRLMVIDEMSTYIRAINDPELLKDQLELPRSKGGCTIGALQGIDEDPKINDIINKTCKQKIYFRTDGQPTKKSLIEDVGNVTFESTKESESGGKNTYSRQTENHPLIKIDDFEDLGEKHEYIAQIGDSLYRGYTPLPRTEIFHDQKTKELQKAGKLKSDEKWTRNAGYVEYSKYQEFKNYLGARYESFQTKKKVQAKIDEMAKSAFTDDPQPTKKETQKVESREETFKEEKKEPFIMKMSEPFGDGDFDEFSEFEEN